MQNNAEANEQVPETYLVHDDSLELASLEKFISDNKLETLS